jgi:hypothetical protein
MIKLKTLLTEAHDYDPSWDYNVDPRPLKEVKRLVDYVLKDTLSLQKALGLTHIQIYYIVKDPNGYLARYISGTSNNPVFVMSTRTIYLSAKKYGVNLGTTIETTLAHEMGHAYLESRGIDTQDHDEDVVEEFTRYFHDTRDIQGAKKILDDFNSDSGALLKEYQDNNIWYHGSASGDLRGGKNGLHLGTRKAANQALEATIGLRADGQEWDGTQEYGKTLLAGRQTLQRFHVEKNYWTSGFNCGGRDCPLPEEDFYPINYAYRASFSDRSHVPFNFKPAVKAYKIICQMTNTPQNPYRDWHANGYMRAALTRGNAKRGYYYKNVSEDEGSVSAVVPNGSCVQEV